jgi:putative alpha-1,2-mannosidase
MLTARTMWSGAASWRSGDKTLLGGRATKAWGDGREMYIALEFSRPFESVELFSGRQAGFCGREVKGKNVKAVVHWKTRAGEQILIKAGLSGVDTRARGRIWRRRFRVGFCPRAAGGRGALADGAGKIRVETKNENDKRVFYSAFYHTLLAPTLFDDVDGRYMGMDGQAHQLERGSGTTRPFRCGIRSAPSIR